MPSPIPHNDKLAKKLAVFLSLSNTSIERHGAWSDCHPSQLSPYVYPGSLFQKRELETPIKLALAVRFHFVYFIPLLQNIPRNKTFRNSSYNSSIVKSKFLLRLRKKFSLSNVFLERIWKRFFSDIERVRTGFGRLSTRYRFVKKGVSPGKFYTPKCIPCSKREMQSAFRKERILFFLKNGRIRIFSFPLWMTWKGE